MRFRSRDREVSTGRSVVVLALVLSSAAASASDWPIARRDPQRTALAEGACGIDRPAIAWRYYLGGELDTSGYLTTDVDGDGLEEAVLAAGGRLVAKRPHGIAVWRTEPLDLLGVEGLYDFDGDGRAEVVARGYRSVLLVRADDGTVLWRLPTGLLGEVRTTRVADLDDDGLPDLYVAECGCCTFTTGTYGVAFAFPRGFDAADVVELWRTRDATTDASCGAEGVAIGDFDGDGDTELLHPGTTRYWAIDGSTGTLEFQSDEFCTGYAGAAYSDFGDVDGDGLPELVSFGDNSTGSVGWRGVAVLDYRPSPSGMTVRWSRSVADPATDWHAFHGGSLADLDGDGQLEIATTFVDGTTGVATLLVLRASDGVQVDSRDGFQLAGVADVTGDRVPELLGLVAGDLRCLALVGGALVERWSLEGYGLLDLLDRGRLATRGLGWRTATQDVDGDGRPELLVRARVVEPTDVQRIQALDAASSTPSLVAEYVPPPGVRLGSPGISQGFTAPVPQLLLVRNDGYLVSFDHDLVPTNFSDDPSAPVSPLQVGGYYSGRTGLSHSPIVAGDATGAPAIVVRDSRGVLVRLDPASATAVVPPVTLWERPSGSFPSAADLDGDGRPEVVYWTRRGDPARDVVEAVDLPTGGVRWATPMTDALRYAVRDLPFGDVDGDGAADVFAEVRTVGWAEELNVLDGSTGTRLWPASFARPGGGLGAPKAVDDIDADGLADLVGTVQGVFHVLDGAAGTSLRELDYGTPYLGLVADVAGDAAPEYLLHGGATSARLLRRSDLSELWTGTDAGPFSASYGALVPCPAGPRLVAGPAASAELRVYDGATGVLADQLWLGAGRAFASAADLAAAVPNPGMLTSVTGVESLTHDGRPAAVVGSTDGHLYAVDPCTVELLWSRLMGEPVGDPVVADLDGDGLNEVLISVADGYLYALGDERMASPEYVWDTDPVHGYPDEDRDTIDTEDTLYGRWAAVPGATSYEYAVLGPGDVVITSPPFVNVAAATAATARGLPLRVGAVYHFAVRASGPAGTSTEILSDGIEVVDAMPPTIRLRAAPRPFTPNGDGLDDLVTLTADMTDDRGLAFWRVVVRSADGATPIRQLGTRAIAGTSTSDSTEWDGVDDLGAPSPDGIYLGTATVVDQGGGSATAQVTIELTRSADGDADADVGRDAEDADELGDVGDADEDAGDHDPGDGEPEAPQDSLTDGLADGSAGDAAGPAWSGGGAGCTCAMGGQPAGRLALVAWLAGLVVYGWRPGRRRRQ
jgi:hypothetical protein